MSKGLVEMVNGWQKTTNNRFHVRRTGTLDVARDGGIVLMLEGTKPMYCYPGDVLVLKHDVKVDSENDVSIEFELTLPKHVK